jgi:hypothetical protein
LGRRRRRRTTAISRRGRRTRRTRTREMLDLFGDLVNSFFIPDRLLLCFWKVGGWVLPQSVFERNGGVLLLLWVAKILRIEREREREP